MDVVRVTSTPTMPANAASATRCCRRLPLRCCWPPGPPWAQRCAPVAA